MTRQDFQLIADVLRARRPADVHPQLRQLPMDEFRATCEAFANRLAATNPRFNRARFLAACGAQS
jgi:hypothetical protein